MSLTVSFMTFHLVPTIKSKIWKMGVGGISNTVSNLRESNLFPIQKVFSFHLKKKGDSYIMHFTDKRVLKVLTKQAA